MNQAPPQQEHSVHRCFSAEPWCSGAVPCDACLEAIVMGVLPVAFARAGLGQHPQVMDAFVDAFRGEAWGNLHAMMTTRNPNIPQHGETPVSQLIAERNAFLVRCQELQAELKKLLEAAQAAPVPAREKATVVMDPSEAALSRESHVHQPEVITAGAPAPRVLTPEDVAAARGEKPANGVTLGNVMTVPPELASHLETNGKH